MIRDTDQDYLDGLEFEDNEADSLEEGAVTTRDISESVLYTLDWTVGTLLDQIDEQAIDLNPDFQRREAWSDERKSRYIESILLNLPTPQLILAEEKDGRFVVIDGKQRLITLSRFFGILGNRFQLKGLEVLLKYNSADNNSYEALNTNGDIRRIKNYPIRTIVLRNATPDELYLIFLRFNSGSVKLSPQELRSALSRGDGTTFINTESGQLKSLQKLLNINGSDFRMRDAELLLRFLAIRENIETYSGNLKRFLDDFLKDLNSNWAGMGADIGVKTSRLDEALLLLYESEPEGFGRKWLGDRYERRVNRALLDPVAYFGMSRGGIELFRQHASELSMIVRTCCLDTGFMDSITSTTKTPSALYTRLSVFSRVVREITGDQLESISYDEENKRILRHEG